MTADFCRVELHSSNAEESLDGSQSSALRTLKNFTRGFGWNDLGFLELHFRYAPRRTGYRHAFVLSAFAGELAYPIAQWVAWNGDAYADDEAVASDRNERDGGSVLG